MQIPPPKEVDHDHPLRSLSCHNTPDLCDLSLPVDHHVMVMRVVVELEPLPVLTSSTSASSQRHVTITQDGSDPLGGPRYSCGVSSESHSNRRAEGTVDE